MPVRRWVMLLFVALLWLAVAGLGCWLSRCARIAWVPVRSAAPTLPES